MRHELRRGVIHRAYAEDIYPRLEPGSVSLLISDGPYGMSKAGWDRMKPRDLPEWYAPHIEAWGRVCAPSATVCAWGPDEGEGYERADLDRLFESPRGSDVAHVPPLALSETETAYEVRLPLPGADPERLDVHVEGNVLRVTGERDGVPDDAARRYVVERLAGRFERQLRLPARVDAEGVVAEYEHGVLRLVLPKAAEARPRRIEVPVR